VDKYLSDLASNPTSPATDTVLEPDLLNLLVQQNRVVKVVNDVVFTADAYKDMANRVIAHLEANGKISLAEVRDMFRTSRKYAQALLEYMDSQRITRRTGDDRVLIKG
jgi:selenocysteine-specific elongation factor